MDYASPCTTPKPHKTPTAHCIALDVYVSFHRRICSCYYPILLVNCFLSAGAALSFPGLNLKPVPKAEPLDKSILKDELGFISIGSQTYK